MRLLKWDMVIVVVWHLTWCEMLIKSTRFVDELQSQQEYIYFCLVYWEIFHHHTITSALEHYQHASTCLSQKEATIRVVAFLCDDPKSIFILHNLGYVMLLVHFTFTIISYILLSFCQDIDPDLKQKSDLERSRNKQRQRLRASGRRPDLEERNEVESTKIEKRAWRKAQLEIDSLLDPVAATSRRR